MLGKLKDDIVFFNVKTREQSEYNGEKCTFNTCRKHFKHKPFVHEKEVNTERKIATNEFEEVRTIKFIESEHACSRCDQKIKTKKDGILTARNFKKAYWAGKDIDEQDKTWKRTSPRTPYE